MNEELLLGEDVIEYAKDASEAKDLWRKYLKYSTLLELTRLQEDSSKMDLPLVDLEKEARETVTDNIEDFFRRRLQLKKDRFFTLYINSFTEKYDPHTSYFSPQDKDDFDVNISGQLEGIGAKLQDKKATLLLWNW